MFFSLDRPVTKNQILNNKFHPKFNVVILLHTSKWNSNKNFSRHLVFSIWYLVTGQYNEKNKSLQFYSTDFNDFNVVGFLQLCIFVLFIPFFVSGHFGKVTKIPKTKRRKYGINKTFDKQWLFYVVLSPVTCLHFSISLRLSTFPFT